MLTMLGLAVLALRPLSAALGFEGESRRWVREEFGGKMFDGLGPEW